MPTREDLLRWGRGENVHGLPAHFPPERARNFPSPKPSRPIFRGEERWTFDTMAHLGRSASPYEFRTPIADPLLALIVDDVPDGTDPQDWICGLCKFNHFAIPYSEREGQVKGIGGRVVDGKPLDFVSERDSFVLCTHTERDDIRGEIRRYRIFLPARLRDGDGFRIDEDLMAHFKDFCADHRLVSSSSESSLRRGACLSCSGAGSVECPSSVEGFTARRSCAECKGTGLARTTCEACGGSGIDPAHKGMSAPEACGECLGSGLHHLSECRADGDGDCTLHTEGDPDCLRTKVHEEIDRM